MPKEIKKIPTQQRVGIRSKLYIYGELHRVTQQLINYL